MATAASICQRWNGEQIDESIGIEIGNRTVPHRIHIVDIRGDNGLSFTWLTVDCDDIRHTPKYNVGPTRTKKSRHSKELSTEFRLGMAKFSNWLDSHEYPLLIF